MDEYTPKHRREVERIPVYNHEGRIEMMPINCYDDPIIDPADARHRAFTTGDVLTFNSDGTVTLEAQHG